MALCSRDWKFWLATLCGLCILPATSIAQTVINNASDLEAIDNNLSGNYVLGGNLDLSGINFTPIGGDLAPFTGSLNGNGYTINNLSINSSALDVGLFGTIGTTGNVQNLSLTGVNVSGTGTGQYVGSLSGVNLGTVSSVSVSGLVAGTGNTDGNTYQIGGAIGENVGAITNATSAANISIGVPTISNGGFTVEGGLVGINGGRLLPISVYDSQATISFSSATGSVTASTGVTVGGLVGENDTIIKNSSSTATVSAAAHSEVGELVGTNAQDFLPGSSTTVPALITSSQATGNVSASDFSQVGGLVGVEGAGQTQKSFSTGTVTSGSNTYAGGLIGYISGNGPPNPGSVTQSFSTSAVSAGPTSLTGGLVGLNLNGTVTQAYAQGTVSGDSTPLLQQFAPPTFGATGGLIGSNSGTVDQTYASGKVTDAGPVTPGGLIGATSTFDTPSTVTSSYWDPVSTGQPAPGDGVGTPSNDLKSGNLALLPGFDQTVWSAAPGQYPTLVNLGSQMPIPPSLPPTTSPMHFILPLQPAVPTAPIGYDVVTQIGGLSSDPSSKGTPCGPSQPYEDPCHTGGGYYSIDLKPIVLGTTMPTPAKVVAAADGVVVFDGPVDDGNGGTIPKIVIYNGNGYFTEYLEFTAPVAGLDSGDHHVSAGQEIATYIPGQTDGLALHFQVQYNDFLKGFPATTYAAYQTEEAQFLATDAAKPSTLCPSGASSAYAKCLELSSNTMDPQKTALSSVTLGPPGETLSDFLLETTTNCTAPGFSSCPKETPVPAASQADVKSPVLFDTFNTIDTTIADSTAEMIEHSPAYLWSNISVPMNADFLSFEFFWENKGDGDYLSLFFNDNLLFNYLGLNFDSPDFVTADIPIWEFAGQSGDLTFELNSVGDPNAVVEIRNLAFDVAVPEPAGWTLLGSALGLLALIRLVRLYFRRSLVSRKRLLGPVDEMSIAGANK